MKALGRLLIAPRNCFYFSSKKEHLMTLTRQLLNNYKTFKPWKNIRLIHEVTFAPYDPEITENISIEREDEIKIHALINELSGDLHQVPHQEINLLLQVLKSRGYRFTNDIPIFRALNKVSKMLLGKHFKANLLQKTLFYLKALHFPKMTTIKMLEDFERVLSIESEMKHDSHKITLTNLIKLVIFSLQEPFITFPLVKKLMGHVLKQNANNLSSFCALYHLSSILRKTTGAKIEYQISRTNARQIIFNPYSDSEEGVEGQSQGKEKKEEDLQKQQIRAKLMDMSNEVMKIFIESVDMKKLQSSIIASVKADIEPFTKESMIYASDILELRPYIQRFLLENIDKLTPVQMIYFTKRCQDMSEKLIETYFEKLGKYMSVEEKAYVLTEANRLFHRPIAAENILDIVKGIEKVEYGSFMAIAKLTELLPKSEQMRIKEILDVVKSKMGNNNEG